MKRVMTLLLALMLCMLILPAMAADALTVDIATAAPEISTDRSYLRLTCAGVEGEVVVTIRDMGGAIVYQRDHGMCSGHFRSNEIYLGLDGASTRYQVSMQAGSSAYVFTLIRIQPRQKDVTACTVGCPLSAITGADTWKTATLLDLNEMRQPITVPIQAGGELEIGEAVFELNDGVLTVSAQLAPDVNGKIASAKVYAATNALDARRLDTKKFKGLTGSLDHGIDLRGARYAAVYVKLTVSFDPAQAAPLSDATDDDQLELLELMNHYTINEEVG